MFNFDEQVAKLNTPNWVGDALDAVARRGVSVHVVENPADAEADLEVQLTAAGTTRTYSVLAKAVVQMPTIKALHDRSDQQVLLVTPRMTAGLATACRNLKVHFADSSGNMFIDWGTLLIDVQGERPPKTPGPDPAPTKGSLRSFRGRGLMVILSLFNFAQADTRTYRAISETCGASLGTVQAVMEELTRLGYLEKDARPRRLHKTRELFDRWLDAYLVNLEPKLILGRYQVEDVRRRIQEPLALSGTVWGGEAAAAVLDPHLLPSILVLYSPDRPTSLLARWRAVKDLSGGNVLVRRRFWTDEVRRSDLAPTPLIYADLVATGEPRQLEAATRLRETDELLQYLDRN